MGKIKEFFEKVFGKISGREAEIGYYPRNPSNKREEDIEKRVEEMKEKYSNKGD